MNSTLTPEQLSKRWFCSPNTVRNLIREGKLSGLRLGPKLIRITEKAIEEFENASN